MSTPFAPTSKTLDTIHLRALQTTALLGPDAWSRSKPQPLTLTLSLSLDTSRAAASDNVDLTFSYGTMCKQVLALIESGVDFGSLGGLVGRITDVGREWPGERLRAEAVAPKAILRAEGGLGVVGEFVKEERGWTGREWECGVRGVRVACVVGVNAYERLEKQTVVVDLKVTVQHPDDEKAEMINQEPGTDKAEREEKTEAFIATQDLWKPMVRAVCDMVEASNFLTLEALAAFIAKICLEGSGLPHVGVRVEKPSALNAVEGAGVEILRDRRWFDGLKGGDTGV